MLQSICAIVIWVFITSQYQGDQHGKDNKQSSGAEQVSAQGWKLPLILPKF